MQDNFIRSYEIKSPFAMMDCDRTFRFFAIGGRENLQIFEINPNNPEETMFNKVVTVKFKGNAQYPMSKPLVNDLAWNKLSAEKLAVGSTTGTVSIYEISSEFRVKLIGSKKEENGNGFAKVKWSPHNSNILLTANAENELQLWDLRVGTDGLVPVIQNVTLPLDRKILDVKFSPHQEQLFALGYESGAIELFDLRMMLKKEAGKASLIENNRQPNLISTAYTQLGHARRVNSLDWNPSDRHILASGCLEKKIKIWDLSSSSLVQTQKIEHVSSLAIIRWLSHRKTMIGASSLTDNQIFFYDTNYKYRPRCIFKGHSDVVKSFLYDPTEQYIISASATASNQNATSVVMQSMKNFIDPYETCPKLPVTIDPLNNILFNLENPTDICVENKSHFRDLTIYKDFSHMNLKKLNQREELMELHKKYTRTGSMDTKEKISEHNSRIAREMGKTSCADLWRNIFIIAFPETNQIHTIESLYEQRIEANITISEERIYLSEKSKYIKEVTPINIKDLLQRFLDEEGELQTVAIVIICLRSIDERVLDQQFVDSIVGSYLEILNKFELFTIASRTLLDLQLRERDYARNRSQFKIACGKCKQTMKDGVTCVNCKTTPLCILCQSALDGLVIWCQYCAHGGHIEQYKKWFAKEQVCPYGCRHKCFTFK